MHTVTRCERENLPEEEKKINLGTWVGCNFVHLDLGCLEKMENHMWSSASFLPAPALSR